MEEPPYGCRELVTLICHFPPQNGIFCAEEKFLVGP